MSDNDIDVHLVGQNPPCNNSNYRCYGEPGFSTVISKQIKAALREGIREEVHDIFQVAIKELHLLNTDESAFVKALWSREKRAQERWENIKVHVLGVGIVAIFGWLGMIVLHALERWRDGGPHP